MPIFDAKLTDIREPDLQALLDEEVGESRILDCKRDRIGKSDSDRREFLADISSFANAAGGHLILGIEETKGIATAMPGIECDDADAETLRLEQIIRTGTQPIIQGVQIGHAILGNGRMVFVIRIPRSWIGPHQVGPTGSFRFYGRASNGKYQLDVDELRQSFSRGPEIAQKLRDFRAGRVLSIEGDTLPVTMEGASLVVTHIVPISNFATGASIDTRAILSNPNRVASLLDGGGRTKTNIDGWLTTSGYSGRARAYAQLYRNGAIESVSYWPRWEVDGQCFLPGTAFDEDIHRLLDAVRELYNVVGVNGSVAAMISLLGIKGWRMGAGRQHRQSERSFDRTPLLCPDVILEAWNGDVRIMAKPLLDFAWNAAGFDRSMNYDNDGAWNPIRS